MTPTAQPGHAAWYKILTWQTGGAAAEVSVQISQQPKRSSPPFPAPVFTACGEGDGTQTCALGVVRAYQYTALQAKVLTPGSAPAGDAVTLSATVIRAVWLARPVSTVVTGTATVRVVAAPPPTPTPTPTPSGSSPGSGHTGSPAPGGGHTRSPAPRPGPTESQGGAPSSGSGQPPGAGASTAQPGTGATGTGLTGGGLTGVLPLTGTLLPANPAHPRPAAIPEDLFPVIQPSPVRSTSSRAQPARQAADPRNPAAASDTTSLGPAGGQVAGLILLGLAIAAIATRFTMRKPRPRKTNSS